MKNSALMIALCAALTATAVSLAGCVEDKASTSQKAEQAEARPTPAPKPDPTAPDPRPVVPRPGPTNTGDPGPPSAPPKQ